MKKLIIIAFALLGALNLQAQDQKPIRKGFTIGGSAGVGVLHFTKGMSGSETQGDISLPNVKIGWFANERTALYLATAGQIYEVDGKDRSFEGFIPSVQYWTGDRMWISGGFGPALDTRAFYASSKDSRKSSWGKGVLLATGYEVTQRPKWAMDIQARLFMASVDQGVELGRLEGTSFTIAVGFTLL
ncbi:MAG: hypothetical protein AAGC88_09075 [Bacteroidota bacterium]